MLVAFLCLNNTKLELISYNKCAMHAMAEVASSSSSSFQVARWLGASAPAGDSSGQAAILARRRARVHARLEGRGRAGGAGSHACLHRAAVAAGTRRRSRRRGRGRHRRRGTGRPRWRGFGANICVRVPQGVKVRTPPIRRVCQRQPSRRGAAVDVLACAVVWPCGAGPPRPRQPRGAMSLGDLAARGYTVQGIITRTYDTHEMREGNDSINWVHD